MYISLDKGNPLIRGTPYWLRNICHVFEGERPLILV